MYGMCTVCYDALHWGECCRFTSGDITLKSMSLNVAPQCNTIIFIGESNIYVEYYLHVRTDIRFA